MKAAFLIGRVLFGGFFLYNGINHLKQREMLSQYAGSKHVPLPDFAVPMTGAAMITGGVSILLGIKPQLGTAAIIGFLAGVSPLMRDFWRVEDPNQRTNEMANFYKEYGAARRRFDLDGGRGALAGGPTRSRTAQAWQGHQVRPAEVGRLMLRRCAIVHWAKRMLLRSARLRAMAARFPQPRNCDSAFLTSFASE